MTRSFYGLSSVCPYEYRQSRKELVISYNAHFFSKGHSLVSYYILVLLYAGGDFYQNTPVHCQLAFSHGSHMFISWDIFVIQFATHVKSYITCYIVTITRENFKSQVIVLNNFLCIPGKKKLYSLRPRFEICTSIKL